ncbi:ferredoxin [Mycobacterium intracellulare]|uniref:ferredoxin n=1 Tax=Mycobacterium intracellulare TaxID=1767 RepID=UPI001EEE4CC9|nr:ferredoxin [Mycobacterium intracellulare]MEE3754972.1 ferredoxin [Mycobacterium intracellulare]
MGVRVDTARCSGIGMCEMAAPSTFEVGEDGQARVLPHNPEGADLEAARQAVSDCPTGALSID